MTGIGIVEAAVIAERERFVALLDNELDQCTCEDPLRHLRQRVLMIAVKGEGEKTNFESYLEEQLKNPQVREAIEGESK